MSEREGGEREKMLPGGLPEEAPSHAHHERSAAATAAAASGWDGLNDALDEVAAAQRLEDELAWLRSERHEMSGLISDLLFQRDDLLHDIDGLRRERDDLLLERRTLLDNRIGYEGERARMEKEIKFLRAENEKLEDELRDAAGPESLLERTLSKVRRRRSKKGAKQAPTSSNDAAILEAIESMEQVNVNVAGEVEA